MANEEIQPIKEIQEIDEHGNTVPKLPKKYQEYLGSAHYNAAGIGSLTDMLGRYNLSDDALRDQATASYQPTYDAERLAQQQKLQTLLQGLTNQLSTMQGGYQRQLNQTAATYKRNLSDMLNNLTKRGMGRSSMVGTGSVAVANAQQAAQQGIMDEWQVQQNNIAGNMALANQQSADALALLDSSYARQIEARMNELRQGNQTASTQLQLQIAQLQYQGYLDWLKTQKKKGKGGGGGGGSGGVRGGYVPAASNAPSSDDVADELKGDGVRYENHHYFY